MKLRSFFKSTIKDSSWLVLRYNTKYLEGKFPKSKTALVLIVALLLSDVCFSRPVKNQKYTGPYVTRYKSIPLFYFQTDKYIYTFMDRINIQERKLGRSFSIVAPVDQEPYFFRFNFSRYPFWNIHPDGKMITDINFHRGLLHTVYHTPDAEQAGQLTYKPTKFGELRIKRHNILPGVPESLDSSTDGHAVASSHLAWFIDHENNVATLPDSLYMKQCRECYYGKVSLDPDNGDIFLIGYRRSNCRLLGHNERLECVTTPFIVKYQSSAEGYSETSPGGTFIPYEQFVPNELIRDIVHSGSQLYLVTTEYRNYLHTLRVRVVNKNSGQIEYSHKYSHLLIEGEEPNVIPSGNYLGFGQVGGRILLVTSSDILREEMANLYEVTQSGGLVLIHRFSNVRGHQLTKVQFMPEESSDDEITMIFMGLNTYNYSFFNKVYFNYSERMEALIIESDR